MRHEYTHAVIATVGKSVPGWMNEGLAKYFEGASEAEATFRCARARKSDELPRWEAVSAPSFVGLVDPRAAGLAYAAATSMVHSLVDKRGEYALQTLMARMKSGETFDVAFQGTYAFTPRQHYDAWVESL